MVNVVYFYFVLTVHSVFIFLFYNVFNENIRNNKKIVQFIGSTSFIIGTVYNLLHSLFPLFSLLEILIYLVSFKIIFNQKMFGAVLSVTIFYFLGLFGETLYVILVRKLGVHPSGVINYISLTFTSELISFSLDLLYLIANSFFRRNSYKRKREQNIKIQMAMTLLLLTLMIIIVNGLYSGILANKYTYSFFDVIYIAGLAAIGLISILFLQMVFQKNTENEELQRYIIINQGLIDELKEFKHNYNNVLHGFWGYIENKDWTELNKYYFEVMEKGTILNNTIFSLPNVKNLALLGLMSQKYYEAKSKNINFEVNIASEINKIPVKRTDICEIFGVYLDNAIEAAAETKEKIVKCDFLCETEFLQFVVSNSYNGKVDIASVYNKGYTTKGTAHGYGLYTVKETIERYPNILQNTFVDRNMFIQEIVRILRHPAKVRI